MAVSDSDVSNALGTNVRTLRTEAGVSLDVFAKRAEVSRGVLLNIEKGEANPSIGTLCKIANGFGVTLQTLLSPDDQSSIQITAVEDVPNLWQGTEGGLASLLFGLDLKDLVEFWKWSIPAGQKHTSEAHPKGTKEIAFVLRGKLEIDVYDQAQVAIKNKAVLFNADVPHAYANVGRGDCEFILVVIEPRI